MTLRQDLRGGLCTLFKLPQFPHLEVRKQSQQIKSSCTSLPITIGTFCFVAAYIAADDTVIPGTLQVDAWCAEEAI